MPELPEVENFKKYLKSTSLNKEILDLKAESKYLVKGITL